jgi:beta-glucosidase
LGFSWGDGPAEPPHPLVGWAIHPEMFKDELLLLTQRYRVPVYVTENGCGHSPETVDDTGKVDDPYRIAYLRDYIGAMEQAVAEGADVRGYFVWSLLDAYEWGSGYGNPFGLIHVDFAGTLNRTIKESGYWYARLIRTGELG